LWNEGSGGHCGQDARKAERRRHETNKGRLSLLLINTPVRVLLESRTALRGAAAYAEASAALSSGISLRAGSPRF